jgi:hypothetical protein
MVPDSVLFGAMFLSATLGFVLGYFAAWERGTQDSDEVCFTPDWDDDDE